MAKTRALEERLLKMAKSEDSHFWIGGPGEEAFQVALGLQVKKGQGPEYDYLHLHYRSAGVLVAMGLGMADAIRHAAAKATDPFTGGRVFLNHYAIPKWNVLPITSPVQIQFSIAPGTALAQLRHGGDAATIVVGGESGTAEADFATCLNWASIAGQELPMLMVITNNQYGISTPIGELREERAIVQRAATYGIHWGIIDGNDPVGSYEALEKAFQHVRKTRKPICLEAFVSRLHGHSSSSDTTFDTKQVDCLAKFESELEREKILTKKECAEVRKKYEDEAFEALKKVRGEPQPDPATVMNHIFA
ncbi:MAG: thiamine pyrophosphate-dependent dehydrogenase E1 component subunit alpha [Pseudomonadota bacterium]